MTQKSSEALDACRKIVRDHIDQLVEKENPGEVRGSSDRLAMELDVAIDMVINAMRDMYAAEDAQNKSSPA